MPCPPVIFHVSFSALRRGITNGVDLTVMYNAQIYSIPAIWHSYTIQSRCWALSSALASPRSSRGRPSRHARKKMQRTLTSAASNIPYGGARHFLREIGRPFFFLPHNGRAGDRGVFRLREYRREEESCEEGETRSTRKVRKGDEERRGRRNLIARGYSRISCPEVKLTSL